MADDVTINPSTGVAVPIDLSMDEIAGKKVQRIKLIHGADGVSSGDVSTANPLPVSAISSGVTVSPDIVRPSDTALYTAGDALANSTSVPTVGGFTMANAARVSGGIGILSDLIIASSNPASGTLLAGFIYIFDSAVTALNDNAAFTISPADIKKLVAEVPFTLVLAGASSYYHARNLNHMYTCVGSADLRYLIKVTVGYTPISAEVITVRGKFAYLN